MRDAPVAVTQSFCQTGVAQTVINIKGLSCPTRSNIITIHYPKQDLPYRYCGKCFEELYVTYSIEEASVGTKPTDIFNLLYSRWHRRIPNSNVLKKVTIGEDEFLLGNSIIIENGKPLIVCAHFYQDEREKVRTFLSPNILYSFNPFHKYVLQKMVLTLVSDCDIIITNSLASGKWNYECKQYAKADTPITSVLLNHIDEIYENSI